MEALWKARRRDGFRVVGVNLSEPPERVRTYVADIGLTFPVVIDSDGALASIYGVRFTPTHFLIDRTGVVRAAGSGGRDWNGRAAHAVLRELLGVNPAGLPK